MAKLTQKNYEDYVTTYDTKVHGTVTPLGKVFGWAEGEKFYWEMEAWAELIDSLMPDWWPIGDIQNLLISIVQGVYDNQAENRVWKGIDAGNSVWFKVSDTITWAQNQISNAVNDMRNRIDSEIIAPIRDRVEREIKPALDQAQKQINDFQAKVNDFQNSIGNMNGQLGSFDEQIRKARYDVQTMGQKIDQKVGEFESKVSDAQKNIGNLDSTIKSLSTKAQNLDAKAQQLGSQLGDINKSVEQIKTWMQPIEKRIKRLEEGQKPVEAQKTELKIPFFG